MKDLGEPLSDHMHTPKFRTRWGQSKDLRRAFYTQVSMSALNLIDKLTLCHNDIRPPNIAMVGDSFCLIDFDMCRKHVPDAVVSAFVPSLSRVEEGIYEDDGLDCRANHPHRFHVELAEDLLCRGGDRSNLDLEEEARCRLRCGRQIPSLGARPRRSCPGVCCRCSGLAPWPPALTADRRGYYACVLKHPVICWIEMQGLQGSAEAASSARAAGRRQLAAAAEMIVDADRGV